MFDSLTFERMTKRYGATLALDDVSITLRAGRVHALMGENGAGKSTLIKLLAGVTPPDRMTARKNGAPVPLASPADAAAAGFRFIHQELSIVPQLSVAENILLGHPAPKRLGVLVHWRALEERAQSAMQALGVTHIDPRAHAGDLSAGDKMLIKLASAFVENDSASPCLYVLDEPTAALQEAEAQSLFAVVRRLKADGAAMLYVSHRIGEVMDLCDDITVLRNGKKVSSCARSETDQARLVRDMTGQAVRSAAPVPRSLSISSGSKSVLPRLCRGKW